VFCVTKNSTITGWQMKRAKKGPDGVESFGIRLSTEFRPAHAESLCCRASRQNEKAAAHEGAAAFDFSTSSGQCAPDRQLRRTLPCGTMLTRIVTQELPRA